MIGSDPTVRARPRRRIVGVLWSFVYLAWVALACAAVVAAVARLR